MGNWADFIQTVHRSSSNAEMAVGQKRTAGCASGPSQGGNVQGEDAWFRSLRNWAGSSLTQLDTSESTGGSDAVN
jgi:hypothetical protein